MTATSRHTQKDWIVFNELGAGELAFVNVADYSPAWHAKIRNCTWILEIDGKSFDDFESVGAPVGAVIAVRAYHSTRGVFETSITLAANPKVKRSPRSASRERVPNIESGRAITRSDRPKWLTVLVTARYLSLAARSVGSFLCNRAIDDHGFTNRWSYLAIAQEIGIARQSVQRAIAELRQAGFLKLQSGRKARRVNGYTATWPAGQAASVVLPFRDRSSAQRA